MAGLARAAALAALLGLAGGLQALSRPLVSVLGTCSSLAVGPYPADTQNWFDPQKSNQVVFYAYLLFPVEPLPEEAGPEQTAEAWHPPMARSAGLPAAVSASTAALPAWHAPMVVVRGKEGDFGVSDGESHYVEAEWLDPDGARIATYGMSLTPRAKADWVKVDGRSYMPHSFAMAVGTGDVRTGAGQTKLPSKEGQYTVRLRVDGRSVGLAVFRILHGSRPERTPAAKKTEAKPAASAAPGATPAESAAAALGSAAEAQASPALPGTLP